MNVCYIFETRLLIAIQLKDLIELIYEALDLNWRWLSRKKSKYYSKEEYLKVFYVKEILLMRKNHLNDP